MSEEIEGPRWYVYGRVKIGLDEVGQVIIRGLHLDRAPTLDMANSFVEDAIAKYGEACVECVVVVLAHGRDKPAERTVIRRLNDFKSWWE
jgi:hypothetical protein